MPYAWKIPRSHPWEGYELAISTGVLEFWERQGDDVTIVSWGDR